MDNNNDGFYTVKTLKKMFWLVSHLQRGTMNVVTTRFCFIFTTNIDRRTKKKHYNERKYKINTKSIFIFFNFSWCRLTFIIKVNWVRRIISVFLKVSVGWRDKSAGGWEAIIYFKYLDTVFVYLECKQIKIFLWDDFIVRI